MLKSGQMAAADLEEGDCVAGACRWVTADYDGGVGGEEGGYGDRGWIEGVCGGEKALEEEEAWGCGWGDC